ncbi:MAG: outer membrane beta-barrel protein [Thiothrix sp.]|nr:outer membrane beta-barrel protein [Thiothrix sp.]HPQ96127.1 outer membrane beta-barrel protein [Thiolinea sp.]
MKTYQIALPLIACLVSGSLYAGGASPFYLGGTIGASKTHGDEGNYDSKGTCENAASYNVDCNIEDSSTVGHIYGGFQFTEGLSVELGYADLGTTADYHYTDPVRIKQDTTAVTLNGVARKRLGQSSPMSVYGKAGVYRWKSKAKMVETDYDGGNVVNEQRVSKSGVDPMVGAGIEYEMNHNITLRAGWDRYFNAGEKDQLLGYDDSGNTKLNTLSTDVDVLSAGVNYYFY